MQIHRRQIASKKTKLSRDNSHCNRPEMEEMVKKTKLSSGNRRRNRQEIDDEIVKKTKLSSGNRHRNRPEIDEMVKKTKLSSFVGWNLRPPELPVDFLFQVFLTLPIQKLFKCLFVSKFWGSIIRHHTFIQAYSSRNPFCLLFSVFRSNRTDMDNISQVFFSRSLYYCNILPCDHHQQEFFKLINYSLFDTREGSYSSLISGGVSEVVNGYFCAYRGNGVLLLDGFSFSGLCVGCPHIHPYASAIYYLGYEPITGLYKLLCIDSTNYARALEERREPQGAGHDFYILTINDPQFSWRRLQLPDNDELIYRLPGSTLIDGGMYWYHQGNDSIRCFDLTTEKFVYINASSSDILMSHDISRMPSLVQFRGKVSLFYCSGRDMIIRSLEKDKSSWTEVLKATLPVEFRYPVFIFASKLSTGQILLRYHDMENPIIQVYAYGDKFERLFVGKCPQYDNVSPFQYNMLCVEQNFEMLESLFRNYSHGIRRARF